LAIDERIEYFKKELSNDEKLLENAFKVERFYKKHKIKIWTILILLFGGFGSWKIQQVYREYKLNLANDALIKLKLNPNDKEALNQLKSNNPNLYNLFIYSKSVDSRDINSLSKVSGKDILLDDLKKYHLSVLKDKAGDSNYYKDLSIVEKAFEDIKSGKKDKAREALSLIDINSPLSNVVQLLRHLTLK